MIRRSLTVLAIAIAPSVCLSAEVLNRNLEVGAVAVARDGRQILQISITNSSRMPIGVSWDSLPWGGGESLLIAAAKWKDGGDWWGLQPAEVTQAHNAGNSLTITPGGTVQGQLALDSRIRDLEATLRTHDVVVFWFWQSDPQAHDGGGRHGGVVVIPRGGLRGDQVASLERASPGSTSDVAVDVDASPVVEDGRDGLQFSIINRTKSELTLPREFLPWVFPPNTVIAVFGIHPPRVLESSHPLIGLPYGEVSLPPNQRVVGTLALDQRVGDIDTALSRSEVVVFWLYAGKDAEGRSLGRHGGYVVFPKGGLDSRQRGSS